MRSRPSRLVRILRPRRSVPKRKNGFGNKAFSTNILEFMTMGVPVIVPDTKIDRYCFHGSVANLFQGGDERSLADAILLPIRNFEPREELVRNASNSSRSTCGK